MFLQSGELALDTVDVAAGPPQVAMRNSSSVMKRPAPWGPHRQHLPVVELRGVQFHAITEPQCIEYILNELRGGRGGVVMTPNLDHLRRCGVDMSYRALLAEADLVVADGMPLVWASRLQGTPLPQRVAGSDLISSLSKAAAKEGRSLFLLGGSPGSAEGAAKVLRERYPEVKIVGIHCPPMGFEDDERQMATVVEALEQARPDIVYLGLGSPKQEKLIQRIRRYVPGAWWLGLGISFSFLCGDVQRAPRWVQRLGLEWVHRLVQEPRRLFKRYIVHGLPFAGRMLGRSALKGLAVKLRLRRPSAQQMSLVETFSDRDLDLLIASERIKGTTDVAPARVEPVIERQKPVEDVRKQVMTATADAKTGRLGRLRALVLLGGSVRPTPLTTNTGRSVLDLPVDDTGSILNHWARHAAELSVGVGITDLPVRVLVNQGSSDLVSMAGGNLPNLRIERDFAEYRGTGGVLGDLAKDYGDQDLILVANAAQLLMDGLYPLAQALDESGGQVSLMAHQDGTPSGLMLITCGALRLIPRSGFVDMKEQALPGIAGEYEVTVVNRRRPTGLPIRSLSEYIAGLRQYHRTRVGKPAISDPLAEEWRPTFSIVEEGAQVDGLARIHDAVVLKGARVEAGAVLVRSVVCPDVVVRRDRTAVDRIVAANDGTRQRG
jgi:N-acetylglucosaminyldiphosphoundecaprenol N-acetyl-beta-D-mannosaminyltransferase